MPRHETGMTADVLLKRPDDAHVSDYGGDICLGHFVVIYVARHRLLKGAAVLALAFNERPLQLGVAPPPNALGRMRGDVGDKHLAERPFHHIAAPAQIVAEIDLAVGLLGMTLHAMRDGGEIE